MIDREVMKVLGIGKKISLLVIVIVMVVECWACKSMDTENKQPEGCCTVIIDCESLLSRKDELPEQLADIIPDNGIILEKTTVYLEKEDSAYDVLTKVCRENKILMEATFTPGTNHAYIEGIANIYEFDAGELSGWVYYVNGENLGVGASEYKVKDNDVIEWKYSVEMGNDL